MFLLDMNRLPMRYKFSISSEEALTEQRLSFRLGWGRTRENSGRVVQAMKSLTVSVLCRCFVDRNFNLLKKTLRTRDEAPECGFLDVDVFALFRELGSIAISLVAEKTSRLLLSCAIL